MGLRSAAAFLLPRLGAIPSLSARSGSSDFEKHGTHHIVLSLGGLCALRRVLGVRWAFSSECLSWRLTPACFVQFEPLDIEERCIQRKARAHEQEREAFIKLSPLNYDAHK